MPYDDGEDDDGDIDDGDGGGGFGGDDVHDFTMKHVVRP